MGCIYYSVVRLQGGLDGKPTLLEPGISGPNAPWIWNSRRQKIRPHTIILRLYCSPTPLSSSDRKLWTASQQFQNYSRIEVRKRVAVIWAVARLRTCSELYYPAYTAFINATSLPILRISNNNIIFCENNIGTSICSFVLYFFIVAPFILVKSEFPFTNKCTFY